MADPEDPDSSKEGASRKFWVQIRGTEVDLIPYFSERQSIHSTLIHHTRLFYKKEHIEANYKQYILQERFTITTTASIYY